MTIQPLSQSYFDQTAKLMRYSWDLHAQESDLVSKEKFDKINMDAWLEKLSSQQEYHAFVAIKDNLVVGILCFEIQDLPKYYCEEKQLFVIDLIVDKDFQKQGIATALEKFAEQYAKKTKINQIAGEIYGFNDASRNLMKKMGRKLGYEVWYKRI